MTAEGIKKIISSLSDFDVRAGLAERWRELRALSDRGKNLLVLGLGLAVVTVGGLIYLVH